MSSVAGATVILGATGKTGREVTRRLYGISDTLVVHARTSIELESMLDTLPGGHSNTRIVPLTADFTELETARMLIRDVRSSVGALGTLINAVDATAPARRRMTVDGHESTWQVNYLAPVAVTLGLLDRVNPRPGGRIINVVPVAYRAVSLVPAGLSAGTRYSAARAYAQSKLSLAVCTQAMAGLFARHRPAVLSLDPEPGPRGVRPFDGAGAVDAVLHACTTEEDRNGAYLLGYENSAPPEWVRSQPNQRTLWRFTCAALGLDSATGQPWNYDVPARSGSVQVD